MENQKVFNLLVVLALLAFAVFLCTKEMLFTTEPIEEALFNRNIWIFSTLFSICIALLAIISKNRFFCFIMNTSLVVITVFVIAIAILLTLQENGWDNTTVSHWMVRGKITKTPFNNFVGDFGKHIFFVCLIGGILGSILFSSIAWLDKKITGKSVIDYSEKYDGEMEKSKTMGCLVGFIALIFLFVLICS